MKTVILLAGKKRTGKDTAAKHIQSFIRYNKALDVAIKSFADPLKSFCMSTLGLTYEQCYGSSLDRESYTDIKWRDINPSISLNHTEKWKDKQDWDARLTARDVLQIVGTDVLRSFYQNIWARAATIAALDSPAPIVIFSDTRFPNEIMEFERLAEEGKINLLTARIKRPGLAHDNHPSELALDKWDEENRFEHVIINDGSIDEFRRKVEKLIKKAKIMEFLKSHTKEEMGI